MAAPNLVNVTSIYGKTLGKALTTTNATALVCAAEKVCKVNTIIVSNIDGSNPVDVTVSFYNADMTTTYHIASTVTVPAKSTLVVLGKDSPIYLEESDQIHCLASAASDAVLICSYEEMDDA